MSAVFDWLIKTHISLRLRDESSLGALWELSGSSMGALWELFAVAGIHIGESLHNGATKVSHHLHGYGRPILQLRCALQPFGIKPFSQAYALVRINPREVG